MVGQHASSRSTPKRQLLEAPRGISHSREELFLCGSCTGSGRGVFYSLGRAGNLLKQEMGANQPSHSRLSVF